MSKFACFLIFLIFLLPVSESAAQFQPEIGLKAGGSFAQLRGEENVFGKRTTDHQPGFMGGLYMDVPLANQLSVQPEVLYVQKGGRMKENFSDSSINMTMTTDFNLDYVQVPLLLKYSLPGVSKISPAIYAGPYASYNLNRDISFKFNDDSDDMNFNIGADDLFRRWDYGATAGADLGYMIRGRKATLGVRYDLGLANIFQDDITFDSEELVLHNAKARNHEVGVVFGFRLF